MLRLDSSTTWEFWSARVALCFLHKPQQNCSSSNCCHLLNFHLLPLNPFQRNSCRLFFPFIFTTCRRASRFFSCRRREEALLSLSASSRLILAKNKSFLRWIEDREAKELVLLDHQHFIPECSIVFTDAPSSSLQVSICYRELWGNLPFSSPPLSTTALVSWSISTSLGFSWLFEAVCHYWQLL